MKVIQKYNQHRRDLSINMECEECGTKDTYSGAYDDRNFWDNVVPDFKCENCGKSTNDLGEKIEFIETRYSAHENI